MDRVNRKLEKFWEKREPRPKILIGKWGDKVFYTLEDHRSIFFFVSATPVKVMASKIKKREESSYITVAVPAKYCVRKRIDHVDMWSISSEAQPYTVSCPKGTDLEVALKILAHEIDRGL